jgi:hypothetical protein
MTLVCPFGFSGLKGERTVQKGFTRSIFLLTPAPELREKPAPARVLAAIINGGMYL